MMFAPEKAREVLRKAGSTNFINYAEITIRMIPAAGLILYAGFSKFPVFLEIFGWLMIITSVVLFFVPRKMHHSFSLKSAEYLKPVIVKLLSPVSAAFGIFIIYSVI